MRGRSLAALLGMASFVGIACSASPEPSPRVAPPKPAAPDGPSFEGVPARWLESSGAASLGPELAEGTMLLLGGRRAIASKAGVVAERAAAPEPLHSLALVPTASGSVVVGSGKHGVYRFDEPLGPAIVLATSDVPIRDVSAGPSLVAVWPESNDPPYLLDVGNGGPHPLPKGAPSLPMRDLVFVDPLHGAAIFGVASLAVTSDGGATWRSPRSAWPGELMTFNGLARRGGKLAAMLSPRGNVESALDLDAGEVGLGGVPSADPDEPPARFWVRRTRRDPLDLLAAGGLPLADGRGLVAHDGLLGRVDPRSGAVIELLAFSAAGGINECSLRRAGAAAWLGCPPQIESHGDIYDPFGIARLLLDRPGLALAPPEILRNGDGEVRASPSGGLLVSGSCKAGTVELGVCVRQPNGRWLDIACDLELGADVLWDRGVAPMADGRIAFLRGLTDDDHGPPGSPGGLHFAAMDAECHETALGGIPLDRGGQPARAESTFEERHDRSISGLLHDHEGLSLVIARGAGEEGTVDRIAGSKRGLLQGAHGVVITREGQILATSDAGATWSELPAPEGARAEARRIGKGEPASLEVSEAGLRVGKWIRVGWGETGAEGEAPVKAKALGPPLWAGGSLVHRAAPPGLLACKTQGTGKAPAPSPILGRHEAIRSLFVPLATGQRGAYHESLASREHRSEWSVWPSPVSFDARGYAGDGMQATAYFEESATPKEARAPTEWSLHWLDVLDPAGEVHRHTPPIPPGMGWGARLSSFDAGHGRALAALRSAGKLHLIRWGRGDVAEIREAPLDLIPESDVAFGTDKAEVIAWMSQERVVVWPKGEAPRVIALARPERLLLGEPTETELPLLLDEASGASLRAIPIPKAAGGKATAPAPVPLDGWTSVPSLRLNLGALATCDAKEGGARFTPGPKLRAQWGLGARLSIDGGPEERVEVAGFEARVSPGKACLTALATSAKLDKPYFVSADLTGKKARGGPYGDQPRWDAKKMSCSLAPR